MKMKFIMVVMFMLGGFYGSAQNQLNEYKYVIVPKRFDDFKQENQYKTSTLVKFLFEQQGFNAVYDDALPPDLNLNRCLGLMANLKDESNMFTTKSTIVLKDCNNQEVFVSEQGVSKIKDYDGAYAESIRKAFVSFDAVNYKYGPKKMTLVGVPPTSAAEVAVVAAPVPLATSQAANVQSSASQVQQQATTEVQSYKDMTPATAVPPSSAAVAVIAVPEPSAKSQAANVQASASPVQQQATTEVQSYKDLTPVASDIKKSTDVLYAQEIPNGYQLVDSTPKIQLKIFKSSVPNVYTAVGEGKNGMVYYRDSKWFFEYYVGDKLTVEELNIKF